MQKIILKLILINITLNIVFANDTNKHNNSCTNSELLGNRLIESICWDCLFPIKILGSNLSNGDTPKDSYSDPTCNCKQDNKLISIGYPIGMWLPNKIIEIVREPGCMLTMNGSKFDLKDNINIGSHGKQQINSSNNAFYHYHYYSFPLLNMIGIATNNCFLDSYSDIDLLYFSELDPSWLKPYLANLIYSESSLVSNHHATYACAADTIINLGQESNENLFWCAGSWGNIYPIVGHVPANGSLATKTSLLATRMLASQHRRGLANNTVGKKAICKPKTTMFIQKDQYRMSMLFPIPETYNKHKIGTNSLLWGEWRNIPYNGEDAVYLLWNWRDCCNL